MSQVLLPPGACDAHVHLARPGLAAQRFDTGYAMPDAGLDALREVQKRNGLERAVIVQLAAYGDDHRVMLEALWRDPDHLRGVACAPGAASDRELAALHDAGVRANRFYLGFPVPVANFRAPVANPRELFDFGPRLAELGWAAEISAPPAMIAELAPRLAGFPVPIVFEHMAGLAGQGVLAKRAARAVLDLVRDHDVWVKLSLCRFSSAIDDADVRRTHDALVAAAPERMLWGSDWPHVGMAPAPDVANLLETFETWIGQDAALKQAIFADNPRRLFR